MAGSRSKDGNRVIVAGREETATGAGPGAGPSSFPSSAGNERREAQMVVDAAECNVYSLKR
jgi:hypothetical protein